MKLKKLIKLLVFTGFGLALGSDVSAMGGMCGWGGGTPGSGIAGTAHDFVSGWFRGAPGLCVFCHTPHKAVFTTLLWNHRLSQNTFSWPSEPVSNGGTPLPGFNGQTYGGASARCVSCHDGSVAIGDVYWYNGASRVLNSSHMPSMFQVGAGGDLTGQHPVAIPYPFDRTRNTYNGVTTGTALDLSTYVADPTQNNMRLYSELSNGTFTAAIVPGRVGMECTTCHDPHNRATVDGCFLRGSLNSSASNYICNACHL